jgi:hypothetical protein
MQWFKHMSDMRHDVKIDRLIAEFGIEGYGLYNLILEMIVSRLDSKSPFPDLEETAADIARRYNADTVKIEKIMLFCMQQGLFDQDEMTGRIVCGKIYKFLDLSMTGSKELKNMILEYKKNNNIMIRHDTSCENRIDKKRREEKRITPSTPVDLERFDLFWIAYGKKTGKKDCILKWNRLTKDDHDAILEHVPKYVTATPDLKYRKNPLTYLNQKAWEDEFLPNQKKQTMQVERKRRLETKR